MWRCTKCPNLWPNENEPRDAAHIPFIENLGGVHMCSNQAGANPHGKAMAAQEAAICIAYAKGEEG